MLDHCAPTYQKKLQTHNWCVMYADLTFYALPTGTKRSKGYVEAGHVRKMARKLCILECAVEYLGI